MPCDSMLHNSVRVLRTQIFCSASTQKMTNTCVIENPEVTVSGFKYLLIGKIREKGISVKDANKVTSWCQFRVDYTARRSWDIGGTFLSFAVVNVFQKSGNQRVGYITLKVSNNFRFDKYKSVASKMEPLLNNLLMYQEKNKFNLDQ